MKVFWKVISWVISAVIFLGVATWLMDKNDIQTFWLFVILLMMQYVQNARHEELIAKMGRMQATLDEIAKT